MKKNLHLLFLLLMPGTVVLAQPANSCIKKTTAYFQVSSVGNQLLDEEGRPVERFIIERFIYIETSSRHALTITSVQSGKLFFNVELKAVPAAGEKAGTRFSDGKQVWIRASGKNKLWKLVLTPAINADDSLFRHALSNLAVSGKVNGKYFKVTIPKESQLKAVEYY